MEHCVSFIRALNIPSIWTDEKIHGYGQFRAAKTDFAKKYDSDIPPKAVNCLYERCKNLLTIKIRFQE
jgi:hypothetical protein